MYFYHGYQPETSLLFLNSVVDFMLFTEDCAISAVYLSALAEPDNSVNKDGSDYVVYP